MGGGQAEAYGLCRWTVQGANFCRARFVGLQGPAACGLQSRDGPISLNDASNQTTRAPGAARVGRPGDHGRVLPGSIGWSDATIAAAARSIGGQGRVIWEPLGLEDAREAARSGWCQAWKQGRPVLQRANEERLGDGSLPQTGSCTLGPLLRGRRLGRLGGPLWAFQGNQGSPARCGRSHSARGGREGLSCHPATAPG